MKILRAAVFSFFIGAILSIVPITVYAACDQTIVFEGTTCTLVGESCDAHVCVCAYNCGPIVE
jgi:hypothetical protein